MDTATAPEIDPLTPESGRSNGPRRLRMVAMLLGVLLGAAVVLAGYAGWSALHGSDDPATPAAPAPQWSRPRVSGADLPDRLGVRLTRVAVSGAGGILDLRFQVVDPD